MSFLFINKTLRLDNLKTRTAINAKLSVFVIGVEAIIYLLLYNLHDCTFNASEISLRWNDIFPYKQFLPGCLTYTWLLFGLASLCFYNYFDKKYDSSYRIKQCRCLLVIGNGKSLLNCVPCLLVCLRADVQCVLRALALTCYNFR